MSPDVLVVDEIGRSQDAEAIMEAVNAGIKLIMTTHGKSYDEINKRPTLKGLLNEKVIERFVILSRTSGPGTITSILDGEGNKLNNEVRVL